MGNLVTGTAVVVCRGCSYDCWIDGEPPDAWWIAVVDGEQIELAPASVDAAALGELLEEWIAQVRLRP